MSIEVRLNLTDSYTIERTEYGNIEFVAIGETSDGEELEIGLELTPKQTSELIGNLMSFVGLK